MERPKANPYDAYYEKVNPVPFAGSEFAYEHYLDRFGLLETSRPLTFALGGFHPMAGSHIHFLRFCQRVHQNPSDTHILLDVNHRPLEDASQEAFPYRLQANLAQLPFKNESIDALFLDATLNFMDTDTIKKFSNEISPALKRNGLVLAVLGNETIPFRFLRDFVGKFVHKVNYFSHSPEELIRLTEGQLKTVSVASCDSLFKGSFDFMVFSRPDSRYPEFHGSPYIIEEEKVWESWDRLQPKWA